jgi:acyl transferase domain-containing protein/acyl-CoA synthetase (AMP-forming)/AMP-acid ligase II/acyl carrier protein
VTRFRTGELLAEIFRLSAWNMDLGMDKEVQPDPLFGPLGNLPLVAKLEQHAREQPNKTACVFLGDGNHEQTHLTYAELDSRARALAAGLQEETVPGQRAILLFSPGLAFLETFLACLYAGIVSVPLYPPRNRRHWNRLHCVMSDADASLVLTTSDRLSRIRDWSATSANPVILPQTRLLAIDSLTEANTGHWQPQTLAPDRTVLLQYTSGSTSAPKGVMVSHANLNNNLDILCRVFELTRDCITVSWLPHYHDMGLIEGHLMPLYAGGTVYLMSPAAFLQQPIRWLAAISKYRATHTAAANFAFDLCVESISEEERAGLDLGDLRTVLNGAEPIRHETVEKFIATFSSCGFRADAMCPGYGLAETTLLVTDSGSAQPPVVAWADAEALKQGLFKAASAGDGRPLVSSGRAAPGIEISVVSPKGGPPLPAGQVGEVRICGASVAEGYWRHPQLSEDIFNSRIPGSGDKGFLRTGDLGFLDGKGELFICGRITDVIIIDGANYYPQDIEHSAIKSHKALSPDAGAAIPWQVNGKEQLVLVQEVRRTERHRLDPAAIFAAVAKAISENHGISLHRLILVRPGTIPKTSSGKIQRRRCIAELEQGSLEALAEWSRFSAKNIAVAPAVLSIPSLKAWITGRVAEVLGIRTEALRSDRPLAEYGLSSREAVSLSGALEHHLGRELPSALIYQFPTIDALGDYLVAGEDLGRTTAVQQAVPIAIIGMACRFPGAENLEALWHLLADGRDAVSEVPGDRWNAAALYNPDPDANGMSNSRWGGFLSNPDQFDAGFFGISPREAASMDPQQRLLLEIAWEALDHAGRPPRSLKHASTGVFVGICGNDYARLQHGRLDGLDAYHATGSSFSLAANRISYCLDLKGPSVAIDTACSSSLVAVHQACRSLQSGESDIALAAGVNMMLTPDLTVVFSRARMMSPNGRCKAFDNDADGYVRGEGCGVVVLKPLDRARADGDQVLAVVRGSAINHGGRGNGLTAPTRRGQEAVIRTALANGGVDPAEVDFVEAHGTGTPLGDPIEMAALADVLAAGRSTEEALWIGSIKTNIGHLEAAAGIAGMIKATLALKHKVVPRHLHFQTLNADIPADGPLRIATHEVSLKGRNGPLICGVSSFGFGGANAHVVLEGPAPAETTAARPVQGNLPVLLPLTAADETTLKERARSLALFLDSGEPPALADLAHTLTAKTEHLEHRAAFVASSVEEFGTQLNDFAADRASPEARGQASNGAGSGVVFVFSGQGTQWIGMGKALADQDSEFRHSLKRLDACIRDAAGWSIFEALDDESLTASAERLQPTLCALQISLANLFRARGLSPVAVVGHSLGEVAAAYAAGALGEEQALHVALQRGHVMVPARGSGGLLTTTMTAIDLKKMLVEIGGGLELAADNGPRSSVAGGSSTALEELRRAIEAEGGAAVRLAGDTPFHHAAMAPFQGPLRAALSTLEPAVPTLPIASTVSGGLSTETLFDADYWAQNIRCPVRFRAALEALTSQGYHHFVEIGPHPALVKHIETALSGHPRKRVLAAMTQDAAGIGAPLAVLAALFADGMVTMADMPSDETRRQIELPAYPWRRQRHWISTSQPARQASSEPDHEWEGCVKAGDRQAGFIPLDLPLAEYGAKWEALNRLALGDMELTLRALHGDGALCADPAKAQDAVVDRFHGLIQRWYQVLSQSGRIEKKDGAYRIVGNPAPPGRSVLLKEARRAVADTPFLTDYMVRCGDHLIDILRGRSEALETLFPGGSWETVEALYHTWPVARYFNAIAAGIVQALVASRGPDNPVRILEAGGGTGGTTRSLLPTLPRHGVSYVFTDVSPYFTEPMRQKLADYPFVSCGMLDLDRDPVAQGHPESGYDVIIAANAVHAVENLPRSLRRIRRLLAQDGVLILYEATKPFPWLDTSVALIEGWDNFNDDLRAGTPLLDAPSWCALLAESGFRKSQSFPSSNSPADVLGQHVIVARASDELPKWQDDEKSLPASWLYQLAWQPRPLSARDIAPSRTLILTDRNGTGLALGRSIETSGGTTIQTAQTVKAPDWRTLLENSQADHVVHLWSLDGIDVDIEESFQREIFRAQALLKTTLSMPPEHRPALWFVTSGACQVGDEGSDPAQAPLWGWARTASNEFPGLLGGVIDVDPRDDGETQAQQIWDEIRCGGGDQVARRAGQRYVCRLARAKVPKTECSITVKPDGLYLISGGLGVLGRRIALHLARHRAGGVILVSRRADPDSLDEDAGKIVRAIEAEGTAVHLVAADVTDERRLRMAIDGIEAQTGQQIQGVVHAAGTLDATPLADLDEDGLHAALHAKAHGAWILHRLFDGRRLDLFALFSSASSVLAPPGHGAYAAANAFLDSLAAHRRHQGLAGTAFSWGVWEEAGTAARQTVERFKELAFSHIPFETGLSLFASLAASTQAHWVILPGELERWAQSASLWMEHPLLQDLIEAKPAASAVDSKRENPGGDLGTVLRHEAAALMNLQPAALDAHRPLLEQGLDSLMAVGLKGRIEALCGVTIPIAGLIGGTSLNDVIELIVSDDRTVASRSVDGGSADQRDVLSL